MDSVNKKGRESDGKDSVIGEHVKGGVSYVGTKAKTDSLQTSKYKTGKDGSTGHGFLAEDANATKDRRCGHSVRQVGTDNAKNGPDRIVDGVQVQTKYCKSAYCSVEAAFDKKTGMYKYTLKSNGRPQQLEVPKDQYDEAVVLMKKKILEGKVPCVKNPNHANKMVRRGGLSYLDAVKMSKNGTVKGIICDVNQNAPTILAGSMISAASNFSQAKRKGKSSAEAAGDAALGAAGSAVSTGTVTVVAGQINRALTPKVINKTADAITKTVLADSAGVVTQKTTKKIVKKGLESASSSAVVTSAVSLAVNLAPDTYHVIKGDVSKEEYKEKVTSKTGSVVGSAVYSSLGSTCGAVMGLPLGPVGAAVGSIIGGLVGSIVGSKTGEATALVLKAGLDASSKKKSEQKTSKKRR